MKLHHLSFEGIGPFREKVDLDFDALGASGLFLLEGATGSGKSPIIDAIVFALFRGPTRDLPGSAYPRLRARSPARKRRSRA